MIATEAKTIQQPIPRIELMVDGKPSETVVKRMNDETYRRRVLRQMLEQRYAPQELDVSKVDVSALDVKIQEILKQKFTSEKTGFMDKDAKYALYLELCFNQSLLQQSLEALSIATAIRTPQAT